MGAWPWRAGAEEGKPPGESNWDHAPGDCSPVPGPHKKGVGLKRLQFGNLMLPTSRLSALHSPWLDGPLCSSCLLSPWLCKPPHGRNPLPPQSPASFARSRCCQCSPPQNPSFGFCHSCSVMLADMYSKRI